MGERGGGVAETSHSRISAGAGVIMCVYIYIELYIYICSPLLMDQPRHDTMHIKVTVVFGVDPNKQG